MTWDAGPMGWKAVCCPESSGKSWPTGVKKWAGLAAEIYEISQKVIRASQACFYPVWLWKRTPESHTEVEAEMVCSCPELPGQKSADILPAFIFLRNEGSWSPRAFWREKVNKQKLQTKHFPLVLVWVAKRCASSFFGLRIEVREAPGLFMSMWLGFLPSSEVRISFLLFKLWLARHEQWEGSMSMATW